MNSCREDVTITAAIIVKDEERCISRCIESILQLFDEIIIVDTGSADNTLNIISGYSSKKIKKFQVTWNDDFSEARNFAISKCTSRYVFFIDADEYLLTTRECIKAEFIKMNRLNPLDYFAYCPEVKDHDNNSSKSIRRGFANNGTFYYSGYVHEELRQATGNKIQDINIGIVIHHDGYTHEVLKTKDKYNRNKALNLKNIQKEPDSLRWNFFYFRDCFEELNSDYIFNSLSVFIKIQHDVELGIGNLKSDYYSFAILDLMAKAKLKSMQDECGFRLVIDLMNEIIPDNSNGIYYDFIYDIFKWKILAKKRIDDILKYKHKKEQSHDGMIHSEGLHIDAALSFYLYEIGLVTQAKKLLLSIEKSGFASEMIDLYLKNINQFNCEEDNGR